MASSVFGWLTRRRRGYSSHNEPNDPSAADTEGARPAEQSAPSYTTAYNLLPLPKQRVELSGIFRLDQWQGFAMVQILYSLGWTWLLVTSFIILLLGFSRGYGSAVLGLILAPTFFLVFVIFLRVLAEMAMSVLLVPHLLAHSTALPVHHQPSHDHQQQQQQQQQQAPPHQATSEQGAEATRGPADVELQGLAPAGDGSMMAV